MQDGPSFQRCRSKRDETGRLQITTNKQILGRLE
jgi:hypothetical protein